MESQYNEHKEIHKVAKTEKKKEYKWLKEMTNKLGDTKREIKNAEKELPDTKMTKEKKKSI